MTEIQQVMTLFTFLVSILVGLQIYLHRQVRQDVRDVRQDVRDVRQEMGEMEGRVNVRLDRMDDRFDRVENDIKILINDVGELKGAAGISSSSRVREPAGTGD